MKKLLFFAAVLAGPISITALAKAPTCNGDVAYYTMLNYSKNGALHSGNLPVITPTNLRIYPNVQPEGSSLNDSMVYVATGDSSGKEIIGYVEFDRKSCSIVPKISGVIEGQDIPL